MHVLIKGFIDSCKRHVTALVTLQASPTCIASGFAMGVFVGIFPTFGLGALVILAISAIWKFNIPAAILGTLIANPLLSPLWITLSCLVGRVDPTEIRVAHETFGQLLGHFSRIGLRFMAGSTAVAVVVATAAYLVIVRLVRLHQRRRQGPPPSGDC